VGISRMLSHVDNREVGFSARRPKQQTSKLAEADSAYELLFFD